MSNLIHKDSDYKKWITAISQQFKQQQIKASIRINSAILEFYWQLGKDIVELDIEKRWGRGVMKSISDDLKNELPEAGGLSQTNLYYTKWFYLTYNQFITNLPQVGGNIGKDVLPIFSIPWTHHKYILDKCKSNPNKALFFVKETYNNN